MKLHHRVTGTLTAAVFALTSLAPLQAVTTPPQIKAPKTPPAVKTPPTVPKVPVVKVPTTPKVPVVPKVQTPPKVPVVKVPATPKVPVVKVPVVPKVTTAPKVPVVVKTPSSPKIPAVKVPNVPQTVKVPDTPKIPVVKTPPVIKTPEVKAAVVSKLPATKPAVASIPSAVKGPAVTTRKQVEVKSGVFTFGSNGGSTTKAAPIAFKGKDNGGKSSGKNGKTAPDIVIAAATETAAPTTRATIQGGNNSSNDNGADAGTGKKKTKDYSDINEAYRRQQQSENADDEKDDPYFVNGVFDREKFRRDEQLVHDFYQEQVGTQDLADAAKKPREGDKPDDNDDDVPVAVRRGRIQDLVAVEGASQITGLNGDEQEVVDAKDKIVRGEVKDPKAVRRLVDGVANKGVDNAFGEAPKVSVTDLTARGDKLRKQGKTKEAQDYYEQAIDALKNGGRNSAEYRLQVIAEVQHGTRPAKDLVRVVKPGTAVKVGGSTTGNATTGNTGAGAQNTVQPATPNQDAAATQPGGQQIAETRVVTRDVTGTKDSGAGKGAGSASAGQQNVNAGAPANTGTQNTPVDQGSSPGVTNQPGADPQNLGANSPPSTAGNTNSSNNVTAGNAESTNNSSVSTPQDQVVVSTPGNDTDFAHYQSPDGNTGGDFSYNADGTFTGTVTTVTRDAQGNITSTETTTMSGTWSEGSDGQRHHNPTSASKTTTDAEGNTTTTGSGGGGGSGDGQQSQSGGGSDDDDDNDDNNNDSTTTTTDTSTQEDAEQTTEDNSDTAEASQEGTPNPEARDRNARSGRLAEMTGGRLGGEEQRRQQKGIEQRKNGNGASTPTGDEAGSSGVMLTREEQNNFARHLGMKQGNGVTTPTGDETSVAVTDRDLKDIAARRGSLINPATGEGKGGSGMGFGKGGFTPAGGGVPTPTPKGEQASANVPAATSASVAGGSSQVAVPAVSAAVGALRGAALRVNSAQVQQNVGR